MYCFYVGGDCIILLLGDRFLSEWMRLVVVGYGCECVYLVTERVPVACGAFFGGCERGKFNRKL